MLHRPPPVRLAVLLALLGLSLVAWHYREPIRGRLRREHLNVGGLRGERTPELPDLPTIDGHPVSLAALRGRVVLLHFWTFACANCEHMIPHFRAWDQRFRGAGLSIVGVHSPETLLEADANRLTRYVREESIAWPVVIDRDFEAWRQFHVHAWPTVVLIDRNGIVRAVHVGDHLTQTIEHEIEALIASG